MKSFADVCRRIGLPAATSHSAHTTLGYVTAIFIYFGVAAVTQPSIAPTGWGHPGAKVNAIDLCTFRIEEQVRL
jgi:hypothetical protein